MRPVRRGPYPENAAGQSISFAEYGDAIDHLIARMGDFCSYCEIQITNPAVEHVQPKSLAPELERDWENFLLACRNCNSIKGNKQVTLNDYLWPDRDNTFRAFHYASEGMIDVDEESIDEASRTRATRLMRLVGLDRRPGHPKFSVKDRRWLKRMHAWREAVEARSDLETNDNETVRKWAVQNAVNSGFWSVWMTVFADDADMTQQLTKAFPGTRWPLEQQ